MVERPDAGAFYAEGGPIGVLMGHGFSGSPLSIRPWAEHLAGEGFTVAAPLFPGHGSSWRELERTRWKDWYESLEAAYDQLAQRCSHVFGFGFSMGGGLVLRLAELRPDAFSALVLVNPSVSSRRFGPRLLHRVPLIAKFIRTSKGVGGDIKRQDHPQTSYEKVPVRAAYELTKLWAAVSADLERVTTPTLIYKSEIDHVVDSSSLELIRRRLTHAPLEVVTLYDSYHVATLDNDASTIFTGSVEWIQKHSATAP